MTTDNARRVTFAPEGAGGPLPGPARENPSPDEQEREPPRSLCFAVLFPAPDRKAQAKDALGPRPRVYPLGESHRAGEALCGLLGTNRAERLGPALFPEPERILRFPVFIRPQDAARRGRANRPAHALADAFGLNADGFCPGGLWGPMLAVCPEEELAWLLVDYCTAPEATRDGSSTYRRLFMYDVGTGLEVDVGEMW